MSDDTEIGQMAHLVWRCEGCPHGREKRHWEIATKLVESAALAPNRDDAVHLLPNCPKLSTASNQAR